MSDIDILPGVFLIAVFSFLFAASFSSYFNVLGFEECGTGEIEIQNIGASGLWGSNCIEYESNRDKVLGAMDRVEQPVSESVLAQLVPGLAEYEVRKVLERYRSETGNVVERVDGWEKVGGGTR
jgi:hypothetical protein